jgi:hypothetical protein
MLLRKFSKTLYKQKYFKLFSTNTGAESILPDHLVYNIPKYDKNPENFDFPWLINGAPLLEIKVKIF